VRAPKLLSSFGEMGMVPLFETRDEMIQLLKADMTTLLEFVIGNKVVPAP
jgi:hypothetical protein